MPTTSASIMVDAEQLRQQAEKDKLIQTIKELMEGGHKLDEKGDFEVFPDEKNSPLKANLSEELKVAAEKVHNDTTVGVQRKIDQWFNAEDFGALVVGSLVNEPYSRVKHQSMLVEHGKLVRAWREAQLAESMAKGPVSMIALKIREYEETHAAEIAKLKAEVDSLIDGASELEG